MDDFAMEILKIVIALVGVILTYKVVPLIKTKITKEQMDQIYFWVQVAVNAAEQIWTDKGKGQHKKEFVLRFLHNQGLNVSEEKLDALIEAAVYELNKMKEVFDQV